jgi:Protein of unknown function (DUF4238)
MAGKNQHYLPQFLQKGFTSQTLGKNRYTWLYRKGNAPIEQEIKHVGADPFFYGDPETEVSADPAITEIENAYALLLDSLRKAVPGTVLPDPKIPLLVSHLAVRTKYVREVARNAGVNLLRALASNFPNQERIRAELLSLDRINLLMARRVERWNAFSRTERERARSLWRYHIVDSLPQYYPAFVERLNMEIEKGIGQLSGLLRANMIKGLADNPSPEAAARRYDGYSWSVSETSGNIILGDTACVVECADGSYRGFDNTELPARSIFLPITSNRLLVGTTGAFPRIGVDTLNAAAARSSCDFFISANLDKPLDELHLRISETAEILSTGQAEALAIHAFLGMFEEKQP